MFELSLWCLAVGGFFGLLYVVARVIEAIFPHDPPPLADGETIASRLGKLHWE